MCVCVVVYNVRWAISEVILLTVIECFVLSYSFAGVVEGREMRR